MAKKKVPKRTGKAKEKGNVYDKVVKENIEAIYENLVVELLQIQPFKRESLKDKIQTTLEREMDSLYKIEDALGNESIIHIEFQASNDSKMIYRMAEYHALIMEKYKLPIRHILIYLGQQAPTMRVDLKDEEIFSSYELINLKSMPVEHFLQSKSPGNLILAILADYQNHETEFVLKKIVEQLHQICPNQNDRIKYFKQLIVLSNLRNLDTVANKIVDTMPIDFKLKEHFLHKEGKEEGIKEGIKEGKIKGIKEGQESLLKELIANWNKEGYTVEKIAKLLSIKPEEVLAFLAKK